MASKTSARQRYQSTLYVHLSCGKNYYTQDLDVGDGDDISWKGTHIRARKTCNNCSKYTDSVIFCFSSDLVYFTPLMGLVIIAVKYRRTRRCFYCRSKRYNLRKACISLGFGGPIFRARLELFYHLLRYCKLDFNFFVLLFYVQYKCSQI
jgi:hypothetical protein